MTDVTKTYTVIGITTQNKQSKVRWTHDFYRRVKFFQSLGFDTRFINLPQPMTKLESLSYLKSHPDFQSVFDQEVIDEAAEYRELVSQKVAGTYVMKKRGRPRKNAITAEQLVQILKETV